MMIVFVVLDPKGTSGGCWVSRRRTASSSCIRSDEELPKCLLKLGP